MILQCACDLGINLRLFSLTFSAFSLRKHAYSNILKILQPNKENNSDKKKSDIFQILLKTKIVGTR